MVGILYYGVHSYLKINNLINTLMIAGRESGGED
jgi:hypothetical protein